VTGAVHVRLMAYDAPSKRTFCLAGVYSRTQAYAYEGEGVWRLLDEAAALGAYDTRTRQMAWRETAGGDGLVCTLDLGGLLDAYVRSQGDTPTAPSRAKPTKPSFGGALGPGREAEVPPEVWLRYQDDTSDKVWFAHLRGTSFIARWGKRGASLQQKESSFASEAVAKAKYQALVKAKLNTGYEHAPDGEAVSKLPGLLAYPIGGGAPSEDVWGGIPQGVPERDWPICEECDGPMIHAATLHADPKRLPLKKHQALMAFVCNSGDICDFWDADAGANKVLLRTRSDLANPTLKAPPKGAKKANRRALSYDEVFEVAQEFEPNAEGPKDCDKVGGYPAWLQGEADPPVCNTCNSPMRFVAQLNERDLNFAGGLAYVFICEEEHEGKLLMQR
jgi:predicted DNA-binding WGR domain protein